MYNIDRIAAGVKVHHNTHMMPYFLEKNSSIKWLVFKISAVFQGYVLLASIFSRNTPINFIQRRPLAPS